MLASPKRFQYFVIRCLYFHRNFNTFGADTQQERIWYRSCQQICVIWKLLCMSNDDAMWDALLGCSNCKLQLYVNHTEPFTMNDMDMAAAFRSRDALGCTTWKICHGWAERMRLHHEAGTCHAFRAAPQSCTSKSRASDRHLNVYKNTYRMWWRHTLDKANNKQFHYIYLIYRR